MFHIPLHKLPPNVTPGMKVKGIFVADIKDFQFDQNTEENVAIMEILELDVVPTSNDMHAGLSEAFSRSHIRPSLNQPIPSPSG